MSAPMQNIDSKFAEAVRQVACRRYIDTVFRWVNGLDPRPFNRADVGLCSRLVRKAVHGNRLYKPGFDCLTSACGDKELSKEQFEEVFKCLESFIKDADIHAKCVLKVFNVADPSEVEVATVLAIHLFEKLVPEGTLTIQKDMKGLKALKSKCACGCGASFKMGNTGIGSADGWHGHPDMIVQDCTVSVHANKNPADCDDDVEGEESNPTPAKKPCLQDAGLKDDFVVRQMISQTITNSFSQSKRNEDLKRKFVPSICCSKEGMFVYAYNVNHDIFISNDEPLPFFHREMETKFYLPTIIEIWLALNILVLGNDSKDVEPLLMKSQFQELEEGIATSVYQNSSLQAKTFAKGDSSVKGRPEFFDITFVESVEPSSM